MHILGIGGIFFKCATPKRWRNGIVSTLAFRSMWGRPTVCLFQAMPASKRYGPPSPVSTEYFGPGAAPFMINYRVANLDAMLGQLRAAWRRWRSVSKNTTMAVLGGRWTRKGIASSYGNRFEPLPDQQRPSCILEA